MKLMVLGGGSCQLNLLKRAKERGHEVVLVDYLSHCEGSKMADLHLKISTFDADAVIKAGRAHDVEGIITLGTDQPIFTAAKACEALGLPFYIDSKTAEAVTNKRVMKKVFIDNAIPTVNYRLVDATFSEQELEDFSFPVVIKPVDSQGQRGVFLIESIDELREKIPETLSYSREEKVLLEDYYPNDEITVNGWVIDGKAKLLSVVDRVTMVREGHIGICVCHHFPSIYMHRYYDEIEDLTQRIVDGFGIQSGPLYFQYLVGDEGIKVNEIAMRIGGAYEDMTMPILSGIDSLDMLFNEIEGKSIEKRKLETYSLRENKNYLSTQLFFCRPGEILSITPPDEMLKLPFVKAIHYNIKPGEKLENIENATARAGYMIVEGSSFDDMLKNVDKAFDHMKILDKDRNNLVIKYKDYSNLYKNF